jgi:DNA-binding protein WhiA
MSFTSDIKKEIIHLGLNTPEERKAALSAFVRTSGFVGENDGVPSFFIVSETENVAEFFMSAFSETFNTELTVMHATMDRMSGRDKLLLQCPAVYAESILQQLYLHEDSVGIDKRLVSTEEDMIAYVKGAFLGGGSCTLPNEGGKTGYHLEIVFSDADVAENFCEMLEELEMLVHLVNRKDTFVVYIKSKEVISDFLSVVGVENSLKRFTAFLDKRDEANHYNRTLNCMAGNADKAAKAAIKQVLAIEKLQKTGLLADMGEELQQLATAGMQHTGMSMQELADYLKVSKSCLNHRMRKLMELAGELD